MSIRRRRITYLTLSFLFILVINTSAQTNNVDISEDEVPFGLQEATEQAEDAFFENNLLSPLDEDVELEDKNPFFNDEYYIERIKAIPGPEEFHVYNDIVKSYIDRYATRLRQSISIMLGKYNIYGNIFDDVLDRYELPEVLRFLPVIESGLNPRARSRAGASGLWQFMASTGKIYGLDINSWVDERNDPYKSTEAAAQMLKKDYETFGDWSLVLAAYNCGAGSVSRAISRAGGVKDFWTIYQYLPRETRGYVPAFIAATYIMNNYSQHNIKARKTIRKIEVDTAIVHYDVQMEQISDALGISVDEIRSFNPQYKTSFIPGGRRRCTMALPLELSIRFAGIEDSLYQSNMPSTIAMADSASASSSANGIDSQSSDYTTSASQTYSTGNSARYNSSAHSNRRYATSSRSRRRSSSRGKEITIRQGDNLDKIARRYGTTVQELRRKNNLSGTTIRAGKKLKVK